MTAKGVAVFPVWSATAFHPSQQEDRMPELASIKKLTTAVQESPSQPGAPVFQCPVPRENKRTGAQVAMRAIPKCPGQCLGNGHTSRTGREPSAVYIRTVGAIQDFPSIPDIAIK